MSAKKPAPDKVSEAEDFIRHVQEILDFQASNGLLSRGDAEWVQKGLDDASTTLPGSAVTANGIAHNAYFDLVDRINSASLWKRLAYMYGLHIWAFVFALVAVLFTLLLRQTLNFSIFGGIPMDSVVWGGLGGSAYSIYHLRKNVYEFQLSKYYAAYWFAYPVAGMIFGLAVTFVVSSGLLSLQAKPSYGVYATIAFLGGTFQQWVLGTLKDIAEAIHTPKP